MACWTESARDAAVARKLSVLVVEDEFYVRLMIADELRAAGYQVIEAANADEAVAVLRSGTEVDLVFSDVRMPGAMDGIGLAQTIRREHPAAKVVLTSSHLSSIAHVDHDGFFAKPYDIAQVIAAIKALTG